jgi:hypothetical protein
MLSISFEALEAGRTRFFISGNKALKVVNTQAAGPSQISVGVLTRVGIDLLKLVNPQADLAYLKAIAQKFNAPGTTVSMLDIEWIDGENFKWTSETPLILEG